MSEAKHTEGPWTYHKCPCGDPICRQYQIGVQGSVGFDEADARLIAAAPDLLEALERLVANLDEGDFISTTRIEEARAVLARVKGEQP